MRLNNHSNSYSQSFKGNPKNPSFIAKNLAKIGDIGEGASIACDFLGKALVVPAVIMAASDEPKEKKEYSAFKNPVAAVIQLALEVPILAGGTKLIGNLADKGIFDKKDSTFSYNEKRFKDAFVDCFKKNCKDVKNSKNFIEEVKTQGYTKQVVENFEEISKNIGENVSETVKNSFKQFEMAHKNKFHLQNRICFLAALLLTPVLCKFEDFLHPKIMHLIYKNRENRENAKILNLNMNDFINQTKKGGLAK